MMSCGACCDPRLPCSPPVQLNPPSNRTSSSSSSSFGPALQNGRVVRVHHRRRFFSVWLHRVSQLLQHPGQATFREISIAVWVAYALYCLGVGVLVVWDLAVASPVEMVCSRMSFMGCTWYMLRMALWVELGSCLGKIIPWALLCIVCIFAWEEKIFTR